MDKLFYVFAHASYEPGEFVGVYTTLDLAKQGILDYKYGYDWVTISEIQANKTYDMDNRPLEVVVG